MRHISTWPRLLLAANGLLMVLGTSMALRGTVEPRDTARASLPSHQQGASTMGTMDMSGGPMNMPDDGGIPLMHMPSLGPMARPQHGGSMGHREPGAATPVDALRGPTTAAHICTFTLTAVPARLAIGRGTSVDAWAYNGSVPGPVLRVEQ